jgi:menaquinone-dependent protoporphyrinogen oxidase
MEDTQMTQVMVIVASRHGGTRGIADRIGETLRAEGLDASVFDASEAPSPQSADAVVIGGAAYMGKWLDEVSTYLRRHAGLLAKGPTWLFASGPVGEEVVDKKGRDLLAEPRFLTDAARQVDARGTKVFFGRWDPSDPPMSFAERMLRFVPVPSEAMPVGDFRDWPAIEAWAREIARELSPKPVAIG